MNACFAYLYCFDSVSLCMGIQFKQQEDYLSWNKDCYVDRRKNTSKSLELKITQNANWAGN